MKGVDQMVTTKQIEQDIFGDSLEGVVWTFPNANRYEGEDKVSARNLELYLEQVLGAKPTTVAKHKRGTFYEYEAWAFPEYGHTVEEDDLDEYLEWAYGATKEYF